MIKILDNLSNYLNFCKDNNEKIQSNLIVNKFFK